MIHLDSIYQQKFIIINMTIGEQLEKNKVLIIGVVIFGLIAGFIFWNFYLSPQKEIKKEQKEELTSEQFEKININFDILEGEHLKELEKMGTIPEYQGHIGKDNPFIR